MQEFHIIGFSDFTQFGHNSFWPTTISGNARFNCAFLNSYYMPK